MVFGSKRDTKPDSLSREDVVGNLYPDSLTSEVDVAQPATTEFPRTSDRGNESVIDPHARFNGKYVSDRDLRIEGEAQGEIECQGTLIISPQARVRSAIKAHNVIVSGDYEGDVDCGGRFEIGSTGRVKGNIKTQVLVVKEGAHWEGGVDDDPRARRATGTRAAGVRPGRSGAERAAMRPRAQGGQPGGPARRGRVRRQHLRQGRARGAAVGRPARGPAGEAGQRRPVSRTRRPPAGAVPPILVEVTRGDRVESVHRGSVAVVAPKGRLVASTGDPDQFAFIRSSAKPFQLAPFVVSGHFDAVPPRHRGAGRSWPPATAARIATSAWCRRSCAAPA